MGTIENPGTLVTHGTFLSLWHGVVLACPAARIVRTVCRLIHATVIILECLLWSLATNVFGVLDEIGVRPTNGPTRYRIIRRSLTTVAVLTIGRPISKFDGL